MADVQLSPADMVITATHELLAGQSDWGTNLQLIDLVNQQKTPAAVVVLAALTKRLTHKKHPIAIVALALLEALVKNCPTIVPLVATPEFMHDLVHTLPKQVRDPNNKSIFSGLKDSAREIMAVERFDKVLLLIDSWARAFPPEGEAVRRDRRLLVFSETFRSLQRAGVKFPEANLDERAPVVTPVKNKSVLEQQAADQKKQLEELQAAERARARELQAQQAQAEVAFRFTDADCASIVDTCTLLTDLLTQSNPREDLRRNELIQQIVTVLKPSAQKIAQRLGQQANAARPDERILAELLQANEIAHEASAYYDGLLAGTTKRRVAQPAAAAQPPAVTPRPAVSASASAAPVAAPVAVPKVVAEKKHVPLLQPPPASASAGSGRSSPSKSPARSPAAAPVAVPVAAAASLLDLDLLFSPAAPVAAVPSSAQQPQQPSRPAAVHASSSYAEPQVTSPPAFEQQQRLMEQAQQRMQQQKPHQPPIAQAQPTHKPSSSFVLAPPPSAGPAADFFSQAAASAVPAAASSASKPRKSVTAAPAPAPIVPTPFDSPDPDDPFLALATRSSPPTQPHSDANSLDDFANFKF